MKKYSILVAEDDADDRFLIQSIYSEKNYEERIEFVENGVELLNRLIYLAENVSKEEVLPDYVLLDLNMPKKDGREVLLEVKQHPLLRKIPIIVFTTNRNEMEIKRCYELGANTYVVKPSSFSSLLEVIESIRNYWFNTAALSA